MTSFFQGLRESSGENAGKFQKLFSDCLAPIPECNPISQKMKYHFMNSDNDDSSDDAATTVNPNSTAGNNNTETTALLKQGKISRLGKEVTRGVAAAHCRRVDSLMTTEETPEKILTEYDLMMAKNDTNGTHSTDTETTDGSGESSETEDFEDDDDDDSCSTASSMDSCALPAGSSSGSGHNIFRQLSENEERRKKHINRRRNNKNNGRSIRRSMSDCSTTSSCVKHDVVKPSIRDKFEHYRQNKQFSHSDATDGAIVDQHPQRTNKTSSIMPSTERRNELARQIMQRRKQAEGTPTKSRTGSDP